MNKEIKQEDKKLLQVEMIRKDGKTFFSFQIDERITKMYADIAQEIRDSERWPNQKFYFCPSLTESEDYITKLSQAGLTDSYGASLIDGNRFNIAWIRTVSGKGEIALSSPLTMAELSQMLTNAKRFIRQHWESQLQNFKITAVIKMQID